MTGGLTLSELLARNPSVQWYEGIAIVRGVVAALLEHHRGDLLALPELHQIELLADGSVVVTGGGPANEPVRRLGQLLQATLSDTDVPVQLRLIVSQATAPMPLYASITEFDEALAYFERPDRGSLLKALVEKAAAIGPATANVVLALDDIAPLPDLTPATAPRRLAAPDRAPIDRDRCGARRRAGTVGRRRSVPAAGSLAGRRSHGVRHHPRGR